MPGVNLADRLFLTADSTQTPQHVAALGIFSPPDRAPDDFVAALADRFRAAHDFQAPFNYRLKHPRLNAIAPAWQELENDDIDLDFNFRHNALPRPAGQRELGQLISRLHSRALDTTRPLWELHLIEGLDDGRFALYFKSITHSWTGSAASSASPAWSAPTAQTRSCGRSGPSARADSPGPAQAPRL